MNYEYDKIGNITKREIYNNLSTAPYRLYEYEYDAQKPHAVKSVTVNGLSHSFTYDEAGNLVKGPDLSNPASPPERWINFNCFNKPKEVYAYSAGLTRKSSFVYDGDKKRILKTVHAGAGRITPMESDAPVAEDLAYGSMAADPQMSWDVEPGLQFQSATAYITQYLEKTTSNLSVW
ncbi:MAG: hypothetical protein GY859_00905, partial [Desulfobacterales bacterium]|nr:hypothetical protein [Desulfobacterales bacterium]